MLDKAKISIETPGRTVQKETLSGERSSRTAGGKRSAHFWRFKPRNFLNLYGPRPASPLRRLRDYRFTPSRQHIV